MEGSHAATAATEDAPFETKQLLARKLTCSTLSAVFVGGFLIILNKVGLMLTAVPDWGADAKQAMIDLERKNMLKLASDKAEYVTEIFGRVKEGLLQVHAFAGEALAAVPETMVVDEYLMDYPGLEQFEMTWDHSIWFVNGLGVGEVPEAGSVLEGLLNRSSLMDVPFRGMQRQHQLVYLAALENPSPSDGTVSDINMQSYAAFNATGYLDAQEVCDERAAEYEEGSRPQGFDPRCRPWYQDAVEHGRVIFTNPYVDVGSGELIVTVAAPVYNSSDTTLLLGVVGIDMDFTEIDDSIKDLRVIDDEGYAYLLAPGGGGEVAVHNDLQADEGTKNIMELESGVDTEEFGAIVTLMSDACTGFETYSRDGSTWMLSWSHETTSVSTGDGTDVCGDGGFIAVVTVDEATLLEAFSKLESEIPDVVAVASGVMALALVAIAVVTGCIARSVAVRITKPVNQLTDVVHALNNMDFSRQGAGKWIVNDISCPELEELIEAFESMVTVVNFANVSLEGGNIKLAEQNYVQALILFKKLRNDRGVGIVNNNLGNVFTLKARELSAQAAGAKSKAEAEDVMERANDLYSRAETNYRLAIEDARMLREAIGQRGRGSSPLPQAAHSNPYSSDWNGDDSKFEERESTPSSPADVESGGATSSGHVSENDLRADGAAFLQLANRQFNLALCLAARANSNAASKGGIPDPAAITEARELIKECVRITAGAKDSKRSQRQVEFLLELAAIERDQKGGQWAAAEAIHAAERVVADYSAQVEGRGDADGTLATTAPQEISPLATVSVLRQQLLAARGDLCVAEGNPIMAIGYWTSAVIGCGDLMDVRAVRSSLEGLRRLASSGNHGSHFPLELLKALRLPQANGKDADLMTDAIDTALTKVDHLASKAERAAAKSGGHAGKKYPMMNVDLCFVMDCTGSMQHWIDQAKNKLMAIIAQAKKDVVNLNLRVAFVGYRDYGDYRRFEGPFDFCEEDELPGLLAELGKIKAYGGDDIPEDVTGGLNHATKLSWRSPTRLCMLIADAPCHGQQYHGSMRDRFPNGCPGGLDPSKLMYTLKYDLLVDLYFVSITSHTDTMINTLEDQLSVLCKNNSKKSGRDRPGKKEKGQPEPQIVVHNLGSNDNRFLETVVKSLKLSINLRVETYQ